MSSATAGGSAALQLVPLAAQGGPVVLNGQDPAHHGETSALAPRST